MRGFATLKQAMRGPKQGMRGKKQGIGALQKSASPVDALRKTRPNPQHKKWMETEITTLLNSYYNQNCCRADSFQHLYINNARKMV